MSIVAAEPFEDAISIDSTGERHYGGSNIDISAGAALLYLEIAATDCDKTDHKTEEESVREFYVLETCCAACIRPSNSTSQATPSISCNVIITSLVLRTFEFVHLLKHNYHTQEKM